jgi:hypothetical protein
MSGLIPEVVTHYHLPDRRPFLNLSDLDEAESTEVMAELIVQRREGRQHRRFGATYMAMRRATEARLRASFISLGGRPERLVPHYFVLGKSAWFGGLALDMRRVTVPLADLPRDQTSVTYPDSFTAMAVGPDFGLAHEPRPYHGRCYRLDELDALISRYGLPDDSPDANYAGYERRPFEKYIEVQLWSDQPIRQWLVASSPTG